MCKKNDYTRRAITALLAVLTALFALALMSSDTGAAEIKENVTAANNIFRKQFDFAAGEIKRFKSIG
ncbi:MAG: hypothetical protein M3525_07915 [Acidobacteriota bacterium]|nr:hypothetical protein [Acidobacteriota bacterium]